MELVFRQGFHKHERQQVWQRASLLHLVLHSVVLELCGAAELSTLELTAPSPLERGVNPSLPWQEFLASLLYKHKSKYPDLKARHSLPYL